MNNKVVYKICPRSLWEEAIRLGEFAGAPNDAADGFIHFSAAHQVKETAAKHFSGQHELVLVVVDERALGDELRWEKSRGGDLFPHLYGVLPTTAAVRVDNLPLDANGVHEFPADLPLDQSTSTRRPIQRHR